MTDDRERKRERGYVGRERGKERDTADLIVILSKVAG